MTDLIPSDVLLVMLGTFLVAVWVAVCGYNRERAANARYAAERDAQAKAAYQAYQVDRQRLLASFEYHANYAALRAPPAPVVEPPAPVVGPAVGERNLEL